MFETHGRPPIITPKTEGSVEHAFVQTHRSGKFLGVARKSPVMQNGQTPGIPRAYDHSYALLLAEIFGPVASYYAEGDAR